MIPKKTVQKKLKYKLFDIRKHKISTVNYTGWLAYPPKTNTFAVSPDRYSDLLDCYNIVVEVAKGNVLSDEAVDKCKEIYTRDFIRRL